MSKKDQVQGVGDYKVGQAEFDFGRGAGRAEAKNDAQMRGMRDPERAGGSRARGTEHSSASSRPDDLDADE